MSQQQTSHWSWSREDVDQRHTNHLRLVTGLSFVQTYKQMSYAMLQLEPGQQVLDIGCGLGDDVVTLAEKVAPNGRVIGIDHSETMLQQAQERHAGISLPVEFKHCDAREMVFDDHTFDAARSDRVLQHIENIERVFPELWRVLKPGGRVVLSETDWESLTLDVTDRNIYRKIRAHHADTGVRNGWLGRQVAGILRRYGFEDITPVAHTGIFTDYEGFTKRWGVWHRAVQSALDAGVIMPAEAESHLNDIEERAAQGQHYLSLTIIMTAATKPLPSL